MGGVNNSLLMKETNRQELLYLIRERPQSRADLARATGLSRAAVTLIVDGLIKEGLVIEGNAVKSETGRRPTILNVNPDDTNVVLGKKCITLHGKGYIEDLLCSLRFKISPLAFYQVNHDCTELLYKTAAEMADVKPTDTLVDLFCGIGTIGLCINSIAPAKRLIGVEIVPQAIENAKENALLNGVTNAEFYCSPAESFDFGTPDVLIVDPPRKGLAPSLVQTIGKVAPKRIVYISCSPDTLARDCSMLKEYGYTVDKCVPVNMFPRTGHVESVVCLTRK